MQRKKERCVIAISEDSYKFLVSLKKRTGAPLFDLGNDAVSALREKLASAKVKGGSK